MGPLTPPDSTLPLCRTVLPYRYYGDVIAINALEPDMRALTNAQLRAKTGGAVGGWRLEVGRERRGVKGRGAQEDRAGG